jgi:hypothetical protein
MEYMEKRDLCDHFRGEIPDAADTGRMAQVEKAIGQYCKGADARLASLKDKYKTDEAVQSALSGYDPHIETQ